MAITPKFNMNGTKQSISVSTIRNEFGITGTKFSDFYRGNLGSDRRNDPFCHKNIVPTSGTISLGQFFGTTNGDYRLDNSALVNTTTYTGWIGPYWGLSFTVVPERVQIVLIGGGGGCAIKNTTNRRSATGGGGGYVIAEIKNFHLLVKANNLNGAIAFAYSSLNGGGVDYFGRGVPKGGNPVRGNNSPTATAGTEVYVRVLKEYNFSGSRYAEVYASGGGGGAIAGNNTVTVGAGGNVVVRVGTSAVQGLPLPAGVEFVVTDQANGQDGSYQFTDSGTPDPINVSGGACYADDLNKLPGLIAYGMYRDANGDNINDLIETGPFTTTGYAVGDGGGIGVNRNQTVGGYSGFVRFRY